MRALRPAPAASSHTGVRREPARNLADDLLRDFEASWWACCRKGDAATVATMLAGGREVLATTVDKDRRTGLHFACGVGSEECVKLLLQNGADVCGETQEGHRRLGDAYRIPNDR